MKPASGHVVVLHLAPFPFVSGGIDTWLQHLLRRTAGTFTYDLLCPSPNSKHTEAMFPSFNDDGHVTIHHVGRFRTYAGMALWSLQMGLKRLLIGHRQAPTLVLGTIPTMLPAFLLRKLGLLSGPILCSVRGALANDARDTQKSKLFQSTLRRMEERLLNCADIVIANGWDTQIYLRDRYDIKSLVVPNAIDADEPRRDSTDKCLDVLRTARKMGKIVLLHVGTVRRVKGIDAILEAYSQLGTDLQRRIELIFVGKGQIDTYRAKADTLGVRACFLGEKANVDDYYDNSDIVINVSGGSGVSNSLLEALSHGRPVVTWDSITFTQVVTDGINGITCRHGDVAALSCGLERAAEALGSFEPEAIRASVAHLSWNSIAQTWIELINGASGRHSGLRQF